MKRYAFSSIVVSFALLFTFVFFSCEKDSTNEIVIPAGSVDALTKAIDDIEENGIIRLAAGTHSESGTVTINKKIKIVGDNGAILVVNTQPTIVPEEPLQPAIHVNGVEGFCIENIELRPSDAIGGTGFILEQSNNSCITNCKIYNHQYSICIQASDDVKIKGNRLECANGWKTGTGPAAHGILLINGKRAHIESNHISQAIFGAWIGDLGGYFIDNTIEDNYIGVVPCAIPDSSAVMPRSNVAYTMIPGSFWTVSNNVCRNNGVGILLYDGASECVVENNDCSNNTIIDIELGKQQEAGEGSLNLPFPVDRTKKNKVIGGNFPNVRVRDCGWGNQVIGAVVVNDGDCF